MLTPEAHVTLVYLDIPRARSFMRSTRSQCRSWEWTSAGGRLRRVRVPASDFGAC